MTPQGRFPRQSQTRRQTIWSKGPNQESTAITSTGKVLWTNGRALVSEAKATIVRIRGSLLMTLNKATTAGDGIVGAVGMGIVSTDAFGQGVASMPGPYDNPEWPGWIWHSYFHVKGVAAQTIGQDVARNSGLDVRLEIDSKAMRKWASNEVLMGVWDTDIETGDAQVNVVADTRILIKLS